MNELEILNKDVGGVTIKEMSAMTFLQWIAKKIDGVKTYDATVVELSGLIKSPPMTRVMSDDKKLEIIGKLTKIGIQI